MDDPYAGSSRRGVMAMVFLLSSLGIMGICEGFIVDMRGFGTLDLGFSET